MAKPIRRLPDRLRGSHGGLVVMALLTGAAAGLGAVIFRYLILWFTLLFTGHADYSGADHQPNPLVPGLGMWFVALAPVVGGLLYGPLIDRFAREARGHGVPEVMLAVAQKGGRIRARVAAIKSLASALCIGSGGSVGREGPIVQIGSAVGSALGQRVGVSEARIRLLVACGAAGGISATFNAPIAGVMFALELILRDFEADAFGVVVLSSVVANVIGRAAFGNGPFLSHPEFERGSHWEYLLYGGLGVITAFAGVGFIRALYGTEDLIDRLWRGPEWLRPAVGGVLLGLILLALPETYGVGYAVLENAIKDGYGPWFLLLLLVGKIAATSVSIGIGGSGGVFAPSLFMGAMIGTAFGQLARAFLPGVVGSPGAYGLVGMGAVFASAARAPITSALIIFELTDDYRIMLPLLTAIGVATGLSNLLTRDTIYSLKLRRLGVSVEKGPADLMAALSVREAMQPVPAALPPDMPLAEATARLAASGWDSLPVVDREGKYQGTVSARQMEEAMRENEVDVAVGKLARNVPTLRGRDALDKALGSLLHDDGVGLPVIGDDDHTVIGWLTHRDVLRAYHRRVSAPPHPAPSAPR